MIYMIFQYGWFKSDSNPSWKNLPAMISINVNKLYVLNLSKSLNLSEDVNGVYLNIKGYYYILHTYIQARFIIALIALLILP